MLLRFDPFREFDRLAESAMRPSGLMPMDAYRHDDHVVAHLDLPGVRAEDVDITVERNVVTVKATRTSGAADDAEHIVSERRHGEFQRQLFLGDTLDPQRLEADVADGVLTLRVPVAETAQPRKIQVGGGGSRTAIDATSTDDDELAESA